MTTTIRIAAMLSVLFLILNIGTQAGAEEQSSVTETQVSEVLILEAISWAPKGLSNSTTACELAKEQGLTQLGLRVNALKILEQTGLSSFPSHLTCQWDATRHAYQTILSLTVTIPRTSISRTTHRVY